MSQKETPLYLIIFEYSLCWIHLLFLVGIIGLCSKKKGGGGDGRNLLPSDSNQSGQQPANGQFLKLDINKKNGGKDKGVSNSSDSNAKQSGESKSNEQATQYSEDMSRNHLRNNSLKGNQRNAQTPDKSNDRKQLQPRKIKPKSIEEQTVQTKIGKGAVRPVHDNETVEECPSDWGTLNKVKMMNISLQEEDTKDMDKLLERMVNDKQKDIPPKQQPQQKSGEVEQQKAAPSGSGAENSPIDSGNTPEVGRTPTTTPTTQQGHSQDKKETVSLRNVPHEKCTQSSKEKVEKDAKEPRSAFIV